MRLSAHLIVFVNLGSSKNRIKSIYDINQRQADMKRTIIKLEGSVREVEKLTAMEARFPGSMFCFPPFSYCVTFGQVDCNMDFAVCPKD